MRFTRSTLRYGETPQPVTPFQTAAQAWDERIGSARVRAGNWRLAAITCLAISLLLAIVLTWRDHAGTAVPFVVEINRDGSVHAVGPATGAYQPSDAQIAYALARFIENVRSLSTDPVVVRQNWLRAYDYASDRAAVTLNEYARQNDPFANVGRLTVAVEMTNVVRASDNSFQIRWIERTYENGATRDTRQWTAMLAIAIRPPGTPELIAKNPLGIFVHSFSWSPDLAAGDSK